MVSVFDAFFKLFEWGARNMGYHSTKMDLPPNEYNLLVSELGANSSCLFVSLVGPRAMVQVRPYIGAPSVFDQIAAISAAQYSCQQHRWAHQSLPCPHCLTACGGCGQAIYPLSAHTCGGGLAGIVSTGTTSKSELVAFSYIGKPANIGKSLPDTFKSVEMPEPLKPKGHKCTCDLSGPNCWNGCTCGGE